MFAGEGARAVIVSAVGKRIRSFAWRSPRKLGLRSVQDDKVNFGNLSAAERPSA